MQGSFVVMTAGRIHQLIRFVSYPTDQLTAWKVSPPARELCNPTEWGRIPFALNAPDFGFQFAAVHHETGTPLPPDILEMSIRGAYWHLTGEYSDAHIQSVLAFEHGACSCHRNLLRAYLMCKDLSLEQIGKKMQQPVEVIKTYGELFFNVRDRMDESIYLASLAFPDTWIKQARTKKLTEIDPGLLLLQLALHEGFGMVDYFGGITNKPPWPESKEWLAREFENVIFKNALLMAQAGFLHQPNMPAIDMAVPLLNARRKGRPRQGICEAASVGGPSVGESIFQTITSTAGSDEAKMVA